MKLIFVRKQGFRYWMYKDGTRGTSSKNRLVTPMRSDRCLNEVSSVSFLPGLYENIKIYFIWYVGCCIIDQKGKKQEKGRERRWQKGRRKDRQARDIAVFCFYSRYQIYIMSILAMFRTLNSYPNHHRQPLCCWMSTTMPP